MSATVNNINTQKLEKIQVKLWMVLVGVNYYQDNQIPDLRYCANDCKELAEALRIATQQFQEAEIIALYDGGEKTPKLSNIINSIQQFSLAKPEDTVLFYFSGHGYLDFNNRPILCVADTNLEDLAVTGLKLDILLNELRQCKAQRQLVWLDACQEREQQQDNIIRQNPTSQLLAVLEQQAKQSQDFYAMLSCDTDERSWEIPELKHGLFTYCLIEGLQGKAADNQGKIDADSLFKYVERSSEKFIKYKINPIDSDDFSKGMGGTLKKSSTKSKIKRLPLNSSQTPQRIARGSGELIIGLAANDYTYKKALIVDNLSSSKTDISLCRILQSRGDFTVRYYFVRDRQQLNMQQKISSCLQDKKNKTVLLYLAGSLEYTKPETYELFFNKETRIKLNWLRKQLQDSPVQEIIIIADILDTSEINRSLIEILQPDGDKSLCLITASTSIPNNKKFLHQLVTTLETAGESSREFWVSELIAQLQEWRNNQTDINLKFWLSGSTEVMEILSVEVQRSYDEIFEIDICPYKSLEAFSQDDAYFFHGREELIAEIIQKLQSTSFLAVVGASGSGKSSVVKAGVIPQLLGEGLFDLESEQFQPCQTWVMLPGDNPIAALAKTLAPDNPDFLEGVLHLGVDSLVEWLHQQPKLISVLAIDQFEELFTLTAETDRFNFFKLLLGVIEKTRNTFKIIITLRSDFLDECLGMRELAPLISKSQVLVPSCRLEDKQYRQIIAQPAQKVGLEVEDGLIAILLGELKEGSLPLLQYALEELWQKRSRGKLTVKDYQQHIGKLGKFLSSKAQETYDNLSEAQKECAQSIFLSLVFLAKEQEDSNKNTRRRLPISDLLVDKYKNVLDSTLQALIEARLIVVSGEENNLSLVNQEQLNADEKKENQEIKDLVVSASVEEETVSNQSKEVQVEIAHEILLRDWEALKCWLEKNREKYRLIREINQKADDWKQNGKGDGFLLSKGALGKYEDFYVNYASELSTVVNQFFKLSIDKRDRLKQQEEARRQKELEQERKARINAQKFIWTLFGGLVVSLGLTGFATWQSHNSRINEINALSNYAEALLASNQELDALVNGLKAGRKIQNSFFGVDNKTRIKLILGLQNIFNQIKEFNSLKGQNNSVNGVAFSPDGRILVAGGRDQTIKLWNLQGKLLNTLKGHNAWVTSVAFSPDGKILVTAGGRETIKLWNLQGKLLRSLGAHKGFTGGIGWVRKAIFSPDGKTIASVGGDDTIKLWNLQGQLLHSWQARTTSQRYGKAVQNLEFSPDGKIIASASIDGTVKLWNIQGKLLYNLKPHTSSFPPGIFARRIAFSPNGKILASTYYDGTVKLWNLQEKPVLVRKIQLSTKGYSSVIFNPDKKIFATYGGDTIKLWNLQGKLLSTLRANNSYGITNVAFSPDGKILASTGVNGEVKLWNLEDNLLPTLKAHQISIRSLLFSPGGNTIVSSGDEKIDKTFEGRSKTLKFWNLEGDLLHTINDPSNGFLTTAFSPDGKLIASAGWDNKNIKLWNIQGKILHTFQVNQDHPGLFVRSIAFSPDSQILAAADDGIVKLWNREGKLLNTFKDKVVSLAFSPDGKLLASSDGKKIKLRNIKGQLISTFGEHKNNVQKIIFSPDSKSIASTDGLEKTIKLWNLKGELLQTFQGHTRPIYNMAFSPDGSLIASTGVDNTLKLWNLKGELLHSFTNPEYSSQKLVFRADGKQIAIDGAAGTIKFLSLELDEVMKRGCNWARDYLTNNPNLSEEERKICVGIDTK
ncbi:MAG: caspase family protein [Cyanobacteria bacterium P01_A01_bin.68]